MPFVKHHTPEEKHEAHKLAARRWARKNLVEINIKNKVRYHENKDAINLLRRERYAERKKPIVV